MLQIAPTNLHKHSFVIFAKLVCDAFFANIVNLGDMNHRSSYVYSIRQTRF